MALSKSNGSVCPQLTDAVVINSMVKKCFIMRIFGIQPSVNFKGMIKERYTRNEERASFCSKITSSLQQQHSLTTRISNDVNELVTRDYDGLIRDTLNISILFNLCFHQTKTPMSNKAFAFIVALILCIPNELSAQSLPNFLPTSDLEGWWPFNGDTSDYVGTNDIKKHAAVFTADRYGSNNAALSIPSTYLELPYASYLDKDDFTISLWVNGGSTQGDRCYVKKGIYSNATREDYYLGLNNSSQFHIGFKGNNSCQPVKDGQQLQQRALTTTHLLGHTLYSFILMTLSNYTEMLN